MPSTPAAILRVGAAVAQVDVLGMADRDAAARDVGDVVADDVELTTSLIIEMPSLPLCLTTLPTKLIESALLTLIMPGSVSVISYLLLCQLPSP